MIPFYFYHQKQSAPIFSVCKNITRLTGDYLRFLSCFRLADMLDRHRMNVHDRDEMSSRRELNQDSIRHLSGKTRGLEEQFKFFQEMRGYVKDLVECMNEKVGS